MDENGVKSGEQGEYSHGKNVYYGMTWELLRYPQNFLYFSFKCKYTNFGLKEVALKMKKKKIEISVIMGFTIPK